MMRPYASSSSSVILLHDGRIATLTASRISGDIFRAGSVWRRPLFTLQCGQRPSLSHRPFSRTRRPLTCALSSRLPSRRLRILILTGWRQDSPPVIIVDRTALLLLSLPAPARELGDPHC